MSTWTELKPVAEKPEPVAKPVQVPIPLDRKESQMIENRLFSAAAIGWITTIIILGFIKPVLIMIGMMSLLSWTTLAIEISYRRVPGRNSATDIGVFRFCGIVGTIMIVFAGFLVANQETGKDHMPRQRHAGE